MPHRRSPPTARRASATRRARKQRRHRYDSRQTAIDADITTVREAIATNALAPSGPPEPSFRCTPCVLRTDRQRLQLRRSTPRALGVQVHREPAAGGGALEESAAGGLVGDPRDGRLKSAGG